MSAVTADNEINEINQKNVGGVIHLSQTIAKTPFNQLETCTTRAPAVPSR